MRIGLIDNYDSFTFNLYQYLAEVNGVEPVVIKNNDTTPISDLNFDAFVISPGPGHPANPSDFGISSHVILHSTRPVLGICLGHQGIVTTHGGMVSHAPEPYHGRTSTITHDGSALFAGIPNRFDVVRYHSLCAHEPLPSELIVTARTDDGLVMALAHTSRPLWGVQFHPESIYAEHGKQLLRNFRDLTQQRMRQRRTYSLGAVKQAESASTLWQVEHRVIESGKTAEEIFENLFGDSDSAFWLDSSALRQGLSRFSFMGDGSGPRSCEVSYRNGDPVIVKRGVEVSEEPTDILAFLDQQLQTRVIGNESLPFDFCGGFVGYLGYELKSLTHPVKNRFEARTPDAALRFIDRFVAYDHHTGKCYTVAAAPADAADSDAAAWFADIEKRIAAAQSHPSSDVDETPDVKPPVVFTLEMDRASYLSAINRSLQAIHEGESYEICLTNRLRASADVSPMALYYALRKHNPAPYSALLRFSEFSVLSSSPERFVRVSPNGVVESKPIKGTRPRGADAATDHALAHDLATNAKDRAENLMITDLVRNDLGQVCQIGSVWTPRLMQVETYASVHQLVSTIRGHLRADCSVIDLVRAAFPGGSMTGAPKLRTMEIIDTLEHSARGVYSGALGYFSLNGACDLNIVIRTIVQHGNELEIGMGGAVISLSDPTEEFVETLVKGRALMKAVALSATGDITNFRISHDGEELTLDALIDESNQLASPNDKALPSAISDSSPAFNALKGAA